MRIARVFACCVAFALLVAGCDTTDSRYFRYGIGTDLYSADIVQTTQFQDLYLTELCRQALPLVATIDGQCFNAQMRADDWTLLVQAGLNDVDRRCDGYLAWLDDRRRTNNAVLKELGDIAVASQAIMRVAGVGANPITLAGLAFGLAANTFTNINSRLLLEVDKTTVQTLVLRRRDQFRLDIKGRIFPDRPSTIHALRSYLTICTPFAIETDINSTVTVFQRAGGVALDNSPPPINSDTVGMPVIRSATAPLVEFRRPPTIPAPRNALNSYERSLLPSDIINFQTVACIDPPTGDLGPLGSQTRLNIKTVLGVSDELLTDRKGILLRRKLRSGPVCPVQPPT